jgi:hypothetical protein
VRGVYDVNKASLRLRRFMTFSAVASVGLAVLTRVFAGHDGDENRIDECTCLVAQKNERRVTIAK